MLPLALFVASLLLKSCAAAGLLGFSLGTKRADGSCKETVDYEADFDAIIASSPARIVRGYSASDCNFAGRILPAARNKGFKVVLGIWADVDSSFNADTENVIHYANYFSEQIYAVTVGSESLYRKSLSPDQLLERINQVSRMLPNIKVGTADSWNLLNSGIADKIIQSGPGILLINAFAYWQGSSIDTAKDTYFNDILAASEHIRNLAPPGKTIEIWTGETGWPSDGGNNYVAAIAGTQNAARFFKEAACGSLARNMNVFYFEAFDEPWKPKSIGDNGMAADETHWGAFDAGRNRKYDLACP